MIDTEVFREEILLLGMQELEWNLPRNGHLMAIKITTSMKVKDQKEAKVKVMLHGGRCPLHLSLYDVANMFVPLDIKLEEWAEQKVVLRYSVDYLCNIRIITSMKDRY